MGSEQRLVACNERREPTPVRGAAQASSSDREFDPAPYRRGRRTTRRVNATRHSEKEVPRRLKDAGVLAVEGGLTSRARGRNVAWLAAHVFGLGAVGGLACLVWLTSVVALAGGERRELGSRGLSVAHCLVHVRDRCRHGP